MEGFNTRFSNRDDPRFLYDSPKLPFSIHFESGNEEFSYNKIVNYSKFGIGFICNEFVEPTTRLVADIAEEERCCFQVVYCLFDPKIDGFLCGLKVITPGFDLTSHLQTATDLSQLSYYQQFIEEENHGTFNNNIQPNVENIEDGKKIDFTANQLLALTSRILFHHNHTYYDILAGQM